MYLEYRQRRCPSPPVFPPYPGAPSSTSRRTVPIYLFSLPLDHEQLETKILLPCALGAQFSTWPVVEAQNKQGLTSVPCQFYPGNFTFKCNINAVPGGEYLPDYLNPLHETQHFSVVHTNGQHSIGSMRCSWEVPVRGQQLDLVSKVKVPSGYILRRERPLLHMSRIKIFLWLPRLRPTSQLINSHWERERKCHGK